MKSKKYYAEQYEATPRLFGKKGRWVKYDYEYKGDYFRYDISDEKLLKVRAIYAAATFACAALFVAAGLLNTQGTRRLWVALPYVFMFLPIAFMAYDSVKQFSAPRDMTEKDRDSIVSEFSKATLALTILSGVALIGTSVFLLTEKVSELAIELVFLGFIMIVFALSFALWRYQRSIPVLVTKSQKANTSKKD